MVIALEVFPMPPFTDIKVYPEGIPFTIDWTGVPIIIVFLGLGMFHSTIAVLAMFIAIGYRNIQGAIFKGIAEFLTLMGMLFARRLLRGGEPGGRRRLVVLASCAMLARGLGMFVINIILLPVFFPLYYTPETAIIASAILIPWILLQALIKVGGGMTLYGLIPESLVIEAGFGTSPDELSAVAELSGDECSDG